MNGATNKITALYCCLSQEDERAGESLSIENQKDMLLRYARERHFPNPTFFVDDGVSGVTYDRPGFQAMLAEIEAERVAVCISKDLSRLGRNSALTGLYTNFTFPQYGVRYIAINDNFDTIDPNSTDSDFAGIKNWFNEFYARDTSRKIRAVNKAKGERGVPLTTNVPYGYLKDPDNPRRWKIDPVAADVVRRIFSMCMEGRGSKQIANQLKADKVLTPPASYKALQGIKSPNKKPEDPYGWGGSTVVAILERREYTGCTVNFKTYTNSIWDKKQRETPVEKQAIFPNTHERIIDDDMFEKVQEIRQQRHRMIRTGRSSIFSGLVYCADCGSKMLYGSSNNGDLDQDFFDCSLHRKSKEKCNGHFIRVKVLERLVLKHIQVVMGYILHHEDYFRTIMEEQLRVESCEQIRIRRKRLESNERRIAELKRLFIKIYEDNASGRLTDERYDMLSQTYEAEQKQLEAEAITLQQEIEVQERQNENIEKFIQKAHKYVGIEELDGYALRELVSAVYVDAPDKSSGKRVQHIHIKYDGLGFIPLNELMKINGVTKVTPPLENTRFSPFFDFTVLRPPGICPFAPV
ncbi:MAG: recombinase family protein [Oscillospiraceae bacterium]